MIVSGTHYRTVWMEQNNVLMIDQNALPFSFRIYKAKNYLKSCEAIINMTVRGAGAIGAAAGFAMAQAAVEAADLFGETTSGYFHFIENARDVIEATRPTARNLFYATEKVYSAAKISVDACFEIAQDLADENASDAEKIGEYGNELIKSGNGILTHCNAGWLGFVDWGSALAPVYKARRQGKDIHVFADETRPRGQGARLTAWELANEKVPFTLIADNAAAHFMSKGMIDMVITGADRIAANGDTANKIGTLEKAILAKTYNIPFYIAAPFSTFDILIPDGNNIPIENRHEDEVLWQSGPDEKGIMHKIRVAAPGSQALNPAFDVTPASYITAFITEKGVFAPDEQHIRQLYNSRH